MFEPAQPPASDYLVVESTHGDRRHEKLDPEQKLAGIIARTAARGGTVLAPAFAVGRAQSLLYYLHRLKSASRMPQIPVFLDSPMAVSASDIFCRHLGDHKLTPAECRSACSMVHYTGFVSSSMRPSCRKGSTHSSTRVRTAHFKPKEAVLQQLEAV